MSFLSDRLAGILLASAFALTGCGTPPADLDLSLRHPSRQGAFVIQLQPPTGGAAINQMHTWEVRVDDAAGTPVTQARIGFDGGMPQHGHGLPTQPRVTRERAPGVYVLEGMKFSMPGWWEMRLDIRDAGGVHDTSTFNVVVDNDGLRR